jgi:hypothetical protein
MRRVYRNFSEFISECSSRELEYFVFDSKFTTMFNKRINGLIADIKKEGKNSVELSIMFNTEGEIAVIDSYILGRYIANNYNMNMQRYYKESSLNNIVKHVVNGSEKSKMDFSILSFNILYNTLKSIYSDIKYKKDTLKEYIKLYNLSHCQGDACALDVATILILEDICKYIGIKEGIIQYSIKDATAKRNCQNS